MGHILCQKHERALSVGVCTHAADATRSGAALPALGTYQVQDEEGNGLPMVFFYCDDCATAKDLPRPARPLTLYEVDAFKGLHGSVPVCLKCLREAAKKA